MKVKQKKDGKKLTIRNAIKAIQDIPGKRKKYVESTDSESMEKDLTPRKKNPKSRALTESDDDLPAPPKRVVRPALTNKGDDSEEDLRAKKNKAMDKGKDKGKATNKGADQTRGGHVPKPKVSVLSHLIRIHPSLCHMSLLSLTETTLYYFFLSDRTSNDLSAEEKFYGTIDHWAQAIPDNRLPVAASGSKPSNRSQAHIPALTNATTHSSNTSALSKSVKISQNVNVKVKTQSEPHDTLIEIVELGLQDDDEMMGTEREAALKSPPKGKVRVSSAVTNHFLPVYLRSLSINRVLLKNHPPSLQQPVLLSGAKR